MSSPVDCDGPLTYVTLMTSDDFLMVLRACFNSSQWPWFQLKMHLLWCHWRICCICWNVMPNPQNKIHGHQPRGFLVVVCRPQAVQTLASSLRASDTKHLPLLVPFFAYMCLPVWITNTKGCSGFWPCIELTSLMHFTQYVSVALARRQLKGNSSNPWR